MKATMIAVAFFMALTACGGSASDEVPAGETTATTAVSTTETTVPATAEPVVTTVDPNQGVVPSSEPVTVFTHCGWYEVEVQDVMWTPSNIERGSMPEGTDGMATEGVFEVIDAERALFTAASGLTVEFVRATADLSEIPPCD